jgi:hypothetical protein
MSPKRKTRKEKIEMKNENEILEILSNAQDGDCVNFSTLPEEIRDDLSDGLTKTAIDRIDDGGENTLYQFEGGILHHDGSQYYWEKDCAGFLDHLSMWDLSSYNDSFLVLCAAFDLSPDVEPVADDATNVKIWVKWDFYESSQKPDCYLTPDDEWEPEIFENVADAQARIDELESGTYHLAHNEAGRPTYTIVE